MEIIDELSRCRAGSTAAPSATFGAAGDMDQAITIRTLVFRGDQHSFQAGAGIVADSDPRPSTREGAGEERGARALAIARRGPVKA